MAKIRIIERAHPSYNKKVYVIQKRYFFGLIWFDASEDLVGIRYDNTVFSTFADAYERIKYFDKNYVRDTVIFEV